MPTIGKRRNAISWIAFDLFFLTSYFLVCVPLHMWIFLLMFLILIIIHFNANKYVQQQHKINHNNNKKNNEKRTQKTKTYPINFKVFGQEFPILIIICQKWNCTFSTSHKLPMSIGKLFSFWGKNYWKQKRKAKKKKQKHKVLKCEVKSNACWLETEKSANISIGDWTRCTEVICFSLLCVITLLKLCVWEFAICFPLSLPLRRSLSICGKRT